jgi:hypothetical protein
MPTTKTKTTRTPVKGLELIDEIDGLEWPFRLHDRSVMHYRVDLFVLGRK